MLSVTQEDDCRCVLQPMSQLHNSLACTQTLFVQRPRKIWKRVLILVIRLTPKVFLCQSPKKGLLQ